MVPTMDELRLAQWVRLRHDAATARAVMRGEPCQVIRLELSARVRVISDLGRADVFVSDLEAGCECDCVGMPGSPCEGAVEPALDRSGRVVLACAPCAAHNRLAVL